MDPGRRSTCCLLLSMEYEIPAREQLLATSLLKGVLINATMEQLKRNDTIISLKTM